MDSPRVIAETMLVKKSDGRLLRLKSVRRLVQMLFANALTAACNDLASSKLSAEARYSFRAYLIWIDRWRRL